MRFRQRAPKRSYLTKREAEVLLSPIARQATHGAKASGEADDEGGTGAGDPKAAKKLALARALAARDHAAFSVMVYAGLRIEEATAFTLEDLSFSRSEEEVRVARGKGNKERLVPMSPKLGKSLGRYLKLRGGFVPAGEVPPPTSSSTRRASGSRRTPSGADSTSGCAPAR